jgi:hypothetical protein
LLPFGENVFLPGKQQILNIFFLQELHPVYMDLGVRFSSCGEYDVDRLECINFYSAFFKAVQIAARLVCVSVKNGCITIRG